MRILLTAHRFWPHVGGTESAVQSLALAFVRLGHHVTVATSLEPGASDGDTLDGVGIRRFRMRRLGRFRLPPAEYARMALDQSWDVVHLHGQRVWSTDHLFPHLGRRRRPFVLTPHGFYQRHMEPGLLTAAYDRLVLRRALGAMDAVVALTAGEEAELGGLGVDSARITRIPDGVDPLRFQALPGGFRAKYGLAGGDRVLLAVGGLYRNKRIDRMIEAVAILARPDVCLVVIGPTCAAREEAACRALARRAAVRVLFLGTVDRGELLGALAEADLLVSAAEFEGFGLALLEAMAAGLPFVATPVGAAAELAETGAGRVADGEPAAFAGALAELLAAPEALAAMRRRGRSAARRYAIDDVAQAHVALYQRVARSRDA
jgi:glycosyltransferase involved in cell wall biosynthesis